MKQLLQNDNACSFVFNLMNTMMDSPKEDLQRFGTVVLVAQLDERVCLIPQVVLQGLIALLGYHNPNLGKYMYNSQRLHEQHLDNMFRKQL